MSRAICMFGVPATMTDADVLALASRGWSKSTGRPSDLVVALCAVPARAEYRWFYLLARENWTFERATAGFAKKATELIAFLEYGTVGAARFERWSQHDLVLSLASEGGGGVDVAAGRLRVQPAADANAVQAGFADLASPVAYPEMTDADPCRAVVLRGRVIEPKPVKIGELQLHSLPTGWEGPAATLPQDYSLDERTWAALSKLNIEKEPEKALSLLGKLPAAPDSLTLDVRPQVRADWEVRARVAAGDTEGALAHARRAQANADLWARGGLRESREIRASFGFAEARILALLGRSDEALTVLEGVFRIDPAYRADAKRASELKPLSTLPRFRALTSVAAPSRAAKERDIAKVSDLFARRKIDEGLALAQSLRERGVWDCVLKEIAILKARGRSRLGRAGCHLGTSDGCGVARG